jgi:hypothetical protein
MKTLRILLSLTIFQLTIHSAGFTQSADSELARADSLFRLKKYTESFQIYQDLLEHNLATPAMLAKMSFIQEGLGDYTNALYYLNLYYLETSNRNALRKMEELAKKHQLQGYEFSDLDFFLNMYHQNQGTIINLLIAIALLFFGILYFQKYRLKKQPLVSLGIYLLVIGGILYLINFGLNIRRGIITNQNVYLMDAPSSGAQLIEIVKAGHRVPITGRKDIWVRIEWNGKPAFIRESNIKKIDS